nr:hypothetical protein [Gracilibacillus boraciitolerans]
MLTDSSLLLWTVIILLVVYFGVVTWIGQRGRKYSKSMNGFATARGKVSPWLVGTSFAASYSSANLFIGVPGLAYQFGTSVLWYTLGCFGVSWIGLLIFSKRFGVMENSAVFRLCRNGWDVVIIQKPCK